MPKFAEGNKFGKGRPKGALNVEKREIAVASRDGFYELHEKIMEKLTRPKASVFAMIEYADLLAKRGWGAPPKKVALPGDERSPFSQLVETMQQHEATQSEVKTGEARGDDEPAN